MNDLSVTERPREIRKERKKQRDEARQKIDKIIIRQVQQFGKYPFV